MVGTITIPMPKPEELPPPPDLDKTPQKRRNDIPADVSVKQKQEKQEVGGEAVSDGGEALLEHKTLATIVARKPLTPGAFIGLALLVVLSAVIFWMANAIVLRQAASAVSADRLKPVSDVADIGPAA
jgi:hypothetical protein